MTGICYIFADNPVYFLSTILLTRKEGKMDILSEDFCAWLGDARRDMERDMERRKEALEDQASVL
jgi:hypothetical protein